MIESLNCEFERKFESFSLEDHHFSSKSDSNKSQENLYDKIDDNLILKTVFNSDILLESLLTQKSHETKRVLAML